MDERELFLEKLDSLMAEDEKYKVTPVGEHDENHITVVEELGELMNKLGKIHPLFQIALHRAVIDYEYDEEDASMMHRFGMWMDLARELKTTSYPGGHPERPKLVKEHFVKELLGMRKKYKVFDDVINMICKTK